MAVKTLEDLFLDTFKQAYLHKDWLRPQYDNKLLMKALKAMGIFSIQARQERDTAINLLISTGVLTQAQAEAAFPNWASTL